MINRSNMSRLLMKKGGKSPSLKKDLKQLVGSCTHGSAMKEPPLKVLRASPKEIKDGLPHSGVQDKDARKSTDGDVKVRKLEKLKTTDTRFREPMEVGPNNPNRAGKKVEPAYKRGGWIQKAINPANKGALHKTLGVPQGQKIPMSKLEKAEHSSNPLTRKRANLAETLRKINRGR